ncbi:MAG: exo 1,3/1,4-beta-D-glucan glucohydrolase [Parasphingorhabdus sp.]|uniref:glycoside hydrolase family 3 protein n=1 Tax=Parasphingorhabdus sp. TaxID=2709688 RepID=UPI0032980FD4
MADTLSSKPKDRSQKPTVLTGSILAITATALMGCAVNAETTAPATPATSAVSKSTINPENWPKSQSPIAVNPVIEQRITALLSKMSLEEKVGQIIQADIGSVTPADVKKYKLGSVLNGGNSAPGGDNRTTPQAWLELADAFWEASTDNSDGGLAIPVLWGTDAVHGHNNIIGATIFPHNIGLGAANNPDLMEEIGRVTAEEIRITGQDWTFAPTIAVVRDDRWGRTYESYSEDPEIVARFASRLVSGIQGRPSDNDFLTGGNLVATVKHFVGDGGTVAGKDQGDNIMSEADLRDLQASGYVPAIEAGVQVVMASYNSWHGEKMHGFKPMLTDVLRGRMGFDGFVVGDWNGHGQVAGCTPTSCAASFNAGLDMFMAPDSWKKLYENTLAQVKDGTISMARLDEAVARILRVKLRSGLFEAGRPSTRVLAGKWDQLGSKANMNVAQQAVRESLVLLKNEGSVLPIKAGANVLVTGDGADDIGKQSGGWTLSWQGTGNDNSHFPKGQSIFAGLEKAVEATGGKATLSADGSYASRPDVAIIVFGEDPYAEFQGDRPHVDFEPTGPLTQLKKYQAENIPTVAIFLSGRPMWVNPELNASDAFVAAWLPGSAGRGVADILVARSDGKPAYDFSGKLSFSWPRSSYQTGVNKGDPDYDPLFAYGYGLSYAQPGTVGSLSEAEDLAGATKSDITSILMAGVAQSPWVMGVTDSRGYRALGDSRGKSLAETLNIVATDRAAQEDVRRLTWSGAADFLLSTNPVDISRQANGDMAVQFDYRVEQAPQTAVLLGGGCKSDEPCDGLINVTDAMKAAAGRGWQTGKIKLSCMSEAGADMSRITSPFTLRSAGAFSISLSKITIVENSGDASCSL